MAPIQLCREMTQDARHAIRVWARRPLHTGFAILALAIGIGANTGVFSVVNALLLRSLPFRDPQHLVALHQYIPPDDSAEQFHQWRQQSPYLSDAAVVEQADINLGGAGEWRRAHAAQTSSNFFDMLGTQPVHGRGFSPGEDLPGRNTVAVISYGLWQDLFGGELRALGSTIRIDGVPLTIVGVAPPGFDYPHKTVVWRPGRFSSGNNGWEAIARLKRGVTWEQARQALAIEAERRWPDCRQCKTNPARLVRLQEELAGPARDASLTLMAGVVLILLIACTNVANLLLARTADRAAEMSIRSALGASRARLTRQLLTECMLLALVSCIAGIVVAFWTTSIATNLQPPALDSQTYSILDGRVLCFAIVVSIACGLLFGVLPSLRAGRIHAFGSRGSSDDRGSRLVRDGLVAAQIILTIVLLAASISVGRAFVKLMHIDRGFDPNGLVTVNVSLEGTTHEGGERRLAYFQEALTRVRGLPDVHSASATEFLPLYATGFIGGPYQLDGRPARENPIVVPVLPDYFQTMRGDILWGRDFSHSETQDNARVAIVSELFASEFGPPANIVGRQIAIGNNPSRTILGVVKGMDYMADAKAVRNQVFVPSHAPGGFFSTFVVRVDGHAGDRLAMVRDAIQSVDPQVPVFGVKTMEQRLDEALARPHFYRTAVSCFAAFALLLVVIGIYGIVSYTVAQRTHEMGIRMALGTTPGRVRLTLLWQALVPVAIGATIGIAGAVLSGRLLESLVEGAKSLSMAIYLASVLVIAGIAALGTWVATRPMSRLDIVEILRNE
jgi:predicted permease